MNKLQEYNKIRTDIISQIRLKYGIGKGFMHIMEHLDNTFIDCPWCDHVIAFRDKIHVRKHYIKH